MSRMRAIYYVRCDAAAIEARASAIAVEQSVEMPLSAISSEKVLREIVGEVEGIRDLGGGVFDVAIRLAVETTGFEAGQLLNMLFGNTSLQEDVTLHDVELPAEMVQRFGGPNRGIEGLRELCGGEGRALTCTALKPQGLGLSELASLAGRLALGGIDFIKDDHGLADQAYSPFSERVKACVHAIRQSNRQTGFHTNYVPNISGDLTRMREQIRLAMEEGVNAVLIAPMIAGVSNFHRLAREFPALAFFAHPALAGAARIAPPLLLGKLFRLFGADATIFPNYGGRFSYTPETCKTIAYEARRPLDMVKPCFPTPAGGMPLDRTNEILDFYGMDTMLLIGGSLLSAGDRLTEAASAFTSRVARHFRGERHG